MEYRAVELHRLRTVAIRVILYTILLFWAAIVLVPIIWMVLSSFKPVDQVLTVKIEWLPREFHWENYAVVWHGINVRAAFVNSMVVAVATTIANVMIAAMAGYGLSKFPFRGRRLILLFILSSIMVPFQVIMIPLFIIAKSLGFINRLIGLIVPGSVTALGVLMMRQTIVPIPGEFCDSARMDGCGEFRVFVSVILPLARVGMITLALLSFLASWNNLLWPMLIIHKEELRTLPLVLSSLRGSEQYGNQYDKLMAVAVIMTMPILALYGVFNKFITRGISVGGLKG